MYIPTLQNKQKQIYFNAQESGAQRSPTPVTMIINQSCKKLLQLHICGWAMNIYRGVQEKDITLLPLVMASTSG